MCDPVTASIATAVIGAGSAGLQYVGQQQAAKQNRINAREEFKANIEALQAQNAEQQAAMAEEAVNIGLEGAAQRAAANTYAATSGASGVSMRQMMRAATLTGGRSQALLEANRMNAMRQSQRNVAGANRQYGADASRVQDPSLAALGLNVANAGLGGYNNYLALIK